MIWKPRLSIFLVGMLWPWNPAVAWTADADDIRENGAPLFQNFSASDYQGASQNWSIVQDSRGLIYVGNSEDGVLEFDGIRWRKIPIQGGAAVRALAVGSDGRIYVGTNGEIGYLTPDAQGQMRYVSLLNRLAPQDRDFADVWAIFPSPEGIYFATFKRLIRIEPSHVRSWTPHSTFHLAFHVNGRVYVREPGRGLLQLVNDDLQLVPHGEQFADERIYTMVPWAGAGPAVGATANTPILVGTRTKGLFTFDGREFRPWKTTADDLIVQSQLYRASFLGDGTLALATLRSGVLLIDPRRRLAGRLDKSMGLMDQTVYDLLQDRQGGLWMALDNGVARVDLASPITQFARLQGVSGSVIAMQRYAGTLYVGTTQGAYRLVTGPLQPARFVAIPQITGQVWDFLTLGDALLIAGSQGVLELRGGRLRVVRPSEMPALSLLQSRADPKRVFVGLLNGLASIRLRNGRWIDEGRIAAVSHEVRTMYQEADGSLWLGTLSNGVLRLPLEPRGGMVPGLVGEPRLFGKLDGLPSTLNSFVYSLNGGPVVATTAGVYRFNAARQRFEADQRFEHLFGNEMRQVLSLAQDRRGQVWMSTSDAARTHKETGIATVDGDAGYRWDARPLQDIAGSPIAKILPEDAFVWFGGDDGVYRYDTRHGVDIEPPFAALVRRVSDHDGTQVFGGAGTGVVPQIEHVNNALRFEYAAPSYGIRPTRFQVLLQGIDKGWSAWSTETYRDYTNIHEGTYRFQVRAMNGYGTVSRTAVYDFRILSPWYRTPLAYLIYLAAAAAVLYGIARWRSAVLKARNRELAQLVAVKTAELSDTNRALQEANASLAELSLTDTLTGLRNRRYIVEHMTEEVAAMQRTHRQLGTVSDRETPCDETQLLFILVDFDHFKQINDRFGHAAGDRVLEHFGAILRRLCRSSDTPVRWGGEEFLVVARQTSVAAGAALAERIRAEVSSHIFMLDEGTRVRTACSIGFAAFPVSRQAPDRFGWETSVNLADQCLYEAKRSGRNAWVGVQATDKALPQEGSVDDLAAALVDGYFELIRMPARSTDCAMAS